MKLDEDYYAGLGIPKNATNIRVRALTADEKDKYIARLEEEIDSLRKLAHDYITAYEKLAFGEDLLTEDHDEQT